VPLDFAGTSLAEALFRARMGLQLGHFLLVLDGLDWPGHKARETGLPLPS
jgi:hypothetical protein